MQYISTRGAGAVDFTTQLLSALASDGGLYLPEQFVPLTPDAQARLARLPFAQLGTEIFRLYTDESWHDILPKLFASAFAGFAVPDITPVRQLSDRLHLLELFHGPTLAFKDIAMRVLAQMMGHALETSGRVANIVVSTSGDTGAAAVHAFANHTRVAVFVLYPRGRISDMQRRQMTSSGAGNIHILAIDGTFDDCQAIVKHLLQDADICSRLSLGGVNSINWTRVLAQTIYYFAAWAQLDCPAQLSFSVPTGNFGDILGGYVAARMGLPIKRLVIATNANDVLPRTLATGLYAPGPVVATTSPAMDIQLPSNFERLLFEASGRDVSVLCQLMDALRRDGNMRLPPPILQNIRSIFVARAVDEPTVRSTIAAYHAKGIWLDPHSAIGVQAALPYLEDTPMVSLATAAAAKFPDAVAAATGKEPPLPPQLLAQKNRQEKESYLEPSLPVVQKFLEARCA